MTSQTSPFKLIFFAVRDSTRSLRTRALLRLLLLTVCCSSMTQAATISGQVVDSQGLPLANYGINAGKPSNGDCAFCSAEQSVDTDANGFFEFDLPGDIYVLYNWLIPPLTRTVQTVDTRGGNVAGLKLTIDRTRKPWIGDTPPRADLIIIDVPNEMGQTQVTGLAGAVPPLSTLVFITLDTGHFNHAVAEEDGSFTVTMTAHAGTSLMIKSDSAGFIAHQASLSNPVGSTGGTDHITTLPGTIMRVPGPGDVENPLEFSGAGLLLGQERGTDLAPPVWTAQGQINNTEFQPGGTITAQGKVEIRSPGLDGISPINTGLFLKLEFLSDAQGTGVMGRNNYLSSFMTPTGLPFERGERGLDEGQDGYQDFLLTNPEAGLMGADIDISLDIPATMPAGYYRPYLWIGSPDIPYESPHQHRLTVLETGFSDKWQISLPTIRIGNPEPAHLNLTLLSNTLSNGSRGTQALEDQATFALAPRIMTQSRDFIIPRNDLNGTPIKYRLEPFAPSVSTGDRVPPRAPKTAFRFPSGMLQVTVNKPDGSKRVISPAPFVQSRIHSPLDSFSGVLDSGGGHITDMYQLSTMDPKFEIEFDQDGLHTIVVDAEIDDISGTRWHGGGSYEVRVARLLVLDTAVLPGTPFEVGDYFLAGLTTSPAVPARIEATLSIAVNSDPESMVTQTVKGKANKFGQFTPDGPDLLLDQAGEYRFDVIAIWEDEQGNEWAGSRTWGGVIAPKEAKLTAHGRRGTDSTSEIGPAWYSRVGEGLPDTSGHLFMPFFSGDVQWVRNNDSIVTSMSFDEPGNEISSIIASRLGCCFGQLKLPGSIDERISIGETPLITSRADTVDPHFDQDKVDLWAYSYRSIQRPMVRVREMIGEDYVDSAYWRFGEVYAGQVGMGYEGDMPNDIKFQYGGVVTRGSALAKPEYAIYGSLAAILPEEDSLGSRVFPPFQGNGGGPSGGPIITFKGQDIDLFINLRAVRPGSILEVGDTFVLAGAIGPTLPTHVEYTVQRPDGSQIIFPVADARRSNLVGYFYQPQDNFFVDQPGVWSVNLNLTFSGRTSAGQVETPFPTGDVLGSDNGSFVFYVTDPKASQLSTNLPEIGISGTVLEEDSIGNWFALVEGILPDGHVFKNAHVTTLMPGIILESRPLDATLSYELDFGALRDGVLNFDTWIWENRGDHLTTSLYVETEDNQGNTHHLGRVINIHGTDVYSLNAKPDTFHINAGLNDAWVHAGAANQGMFITVFPSFELMFAAWFSFDSVAPPAEATAVVGAPDQRWVTALGSYSGTSATLKAEMTSGGRFNNSDGTPLQDTNYGTINMEFTGCNSVNVDFEFPGPGESGSFVASRVLPDNVSVCEGIVSGDIAPASVSTLEQAKRLSSIIKGTKTEAKSATFMINSGLNDAWVNADAGFQGMFLTIFPDFELMFAAWFTFDTEDNGETATFGAPDQRWLTALGSYSGTTASLNIENTTGGAFNSTTPTPTQDTGYGTMDIDFSDCNNATVTYNIPGAAQEGTFTMSRVLDDNVGLCEALSN